MPMIKLQTGWLIWKYGQGGNLKIKYLVKEANLRTERWKKQRKKKKEEAQVGVFILICPLDMGCLFKEATKDLGMIEI